MQNSLYAIVYRPHDALKTLHSLDRVSKNIHNHYQCDRNPSHSAQLPGLMFGPIAPKNTLLVPQLTPFHAPCPVFPPAPDPVLIMHPLPSFLSFLSLMPLILLRNPSSHLPHPPIIPPHKSSSVSLMTRKWAPKIATDTDLSLTIPTSQMTLPLRHISTTLKVPTPKRAIRR